uniref:ribosomal protein L13 n=1 Tax=Erythrolobus coxiae TaxID=362235 RepID=UPI001FCD3794|nr:ribosomal protein L13 [Erythrolobus coxiae]UNJ17696.1 ribosomal protein L13 [Erythrolobus coxiae]
MNITKFSDNNQTDTKWYLVDAKDKTLGRLSTVVASVLRGKNSPYYSPHTNLKHHIVVINAEKITVTGQKTSQKLYRRHSGTPGGMKVETFKQVQERLPSRILEHSIRGMLPKGPLGRKLFTQLKVYTGENHPHEAQKPLIINI